MVKKEFLKISVLHSAASLALHGKILQVQWRRMLYLSLLKDSVGHCMKDTDIKVFSKPNLHVYE